MTERDVILNAVKRLNLVAKKWQSEEEHISENEITIKAYYDIRVSFDDNGNITGFDSHP